MNTKEKVVKRNSEEFEIYLGRTKGTYSEKVYLTGFNWNCGWYWGGGYISSKSMHCHFDGCFLDVIDERGHNLGNFVSPWNPNTGKDGYTTVDNGCSVWVSLDFFLDDAQFTNNEWWRIKDLYKQFYSLCDAAEVFKYGGHCSVTGRNKKESNPKMAEEINDHIEEVIIPEIIKTLTIDHKEVQKKERQKYQGKNI